MFVTDFGKKASIYVYIDQSGIINNRGVLIKQLNDYKYYIFISRFLQNNIKLNSKYGHDNISIKMIQNVAILLSFPLKIIFESPLKSFNFSDSIGRIKFKKF